MLEKKTAWSRFQIVSGFYRLKLDFFLDTFFQYFPFCLSNKLFIGDSIEIKAFVLYLRIIFDRNENKKLINIYYQPCTISSSLEILRSVRKIKLLNFGRIIKFKRDIYIIVTYIDYTVTHSAPTLKSSVEKKYAELKLNVVLCFTFI